MANENDVVRLKHLQPLVSGVANDFSVQNGDNAVRLKHLVSLATALDNDKQTPVLSLGSWSAVDTVYSAPITYTGDGTLATDIGTIANDILTVADEDGNFNGVISASAGDDFNDSSLAFNFTTDTITIQGGEDRLSKILNGGNDFSFHNDTSFYSGKINIAIDNSGSNHRINNAETGARLFVWEDYSAYTYFISQMHKINERAGIVLYDKTSTVTSNDRFCKVANGFYFIKPDDFTTNGAVVVSTSRSSVTSIFQKDDVEIVQSLDNPYTFLAISKNYASANKYVINAKMFTMAERLYSSPSIIAATTIGTVDSTSTTQNNIDNYGFIKGYKPVLSFNGEEVTVTKDTTKEWITPLFFYEKRTRNSSGSITSGGDYIFIPRNEHALVYWENYQLSSISGDAVSSVKTWLDSDDIISGIHRSKTHTFFYIVTYKEGTYTGIDDCFNIWDLNNYNANITKTDLKLSDIIDDILI